MILILAAMEIVLAMVAPSPLHRRGLAGSRPGPRGGRVATLDRVRVLPTDPAAAAWFIATRNGRNSHPPA